MGTRDALRQLVAEIRKYEARSTAAAEGTAHLRDAVIKDLEAKHKLLDATQQAIADYREQAAEAAQLGDQLASMADALEAGNCPICGQRANDQPLPESLATLH